MVVNTASDGKPEFAPVDVERDIVESGVHRAVGAELFFQIADAEDDGALPDALETRGDSGRKLAVIGDREVHAGMGLGRSRDHNEGRPLAVRVFLFHGNKTVPSHARKTSVEKPMMPIIMMAERIAAMLRTEMG